MSVPSFSTLAPSLRIEERSAKAAFSAKPRNKTGNNFMPIEWSKTNIIGKPISFHHKTCPCEIVTGQPM
jgi:hypothetical protein